MFTRALIIAIPTLLTNLCPTTLIALKAWYVRLQAVTSTQSNGFALL